MYYNPGSSDPTQPRQHPVQLRRPRPGRGGGCLLPALMALLMPLLICGACVSVYLVFPPPHRNILVMGLDARPGEGVVARTDSIMLVGVKPAQFRVSVLSIPRDLFINVPGYGMQRINTVNVLGETDAATDGPALLRAGILQNFGIESHHYVRLNFQGFVELIDALGGVTIDVERVIVDHAYPTADGGVMTVRFESGQQHMNGERALIYARTRSGDDDYQRARRQQQVLAALVRRLQDPTTWPAAIAVLNRHMETSISLVDAAMLAPSLIFSAGRFEQLVIDRDYILPSGEGYNVPNYPLIATWTHERFR